MAKKQEQSGAHERSVAQEIRTLTKRLKKRLGITRPRPGVIQGRGSHLINALDDAAGRGRGG